jgi:hypothetical protein
MHFVLRTKYRFKSGNDFFVSWYGKPKIFPMAPDNHIEWNELVDLAGYITPVIYYDISDVESLPSETKIPTFSSVLRSRQQGQFDGILRRGLFRRD